MEEPVQHLRPKEEALRRMADDRVLVSRHWANWETAIDVKGRKEKVDGDLKC